MGSTSRDWIARLKLENAEALASAQEVLDAKEELSEEEQLQLDTEDARREMAEANALGAELLGVFGDIAGINLGPLASSIQLIGTRAGNILLGITGVSTAVSFLIDKTNDWNDRITAAGESWEAVLTAANQADAFATFVSEFSDQLDILEDAGFTVAEIYQAVQDGIQLDVPDYQQGFFEKLSDWTVDANKYRDAWVEINEGFDDAEGRLETTARRQEELTIAQIESQVAAQEQVFAISDVQEAYLKSGQAAEEAGTQSERALEAQQNAAEIAAQKVDAIRDAHDRLKDSVADDQAILNLERRFEEFEQAAIDAYVSAQEESEDAEANARDYEQAQIDLKNAVIDYHEEVEALPPELVTDIFADIDEGSIASAEATLRALTRTRHIRVTVGLPGALGPGGQPLGNSDWGWGGRSSTGTRTRSAPSAQSNQGLTPVPRSTGGNITTNLTVRTTLTGRQLRRTLDKWGRVNGTLE